MTLKRFVLDIPCLHCCWRRGTNGGRSQKKLINAKERIIPRMSIAATIAHSVPPRLKQALRRNRRVDVLLRRSFAFLLRVGGKTVMIESGPLAGLRLSVSEHTSH